MAILKKSEHIAIYISIAAFLISSASFYFQFFYISESVNIAKLDLKQVHWGYDINLAVSNVGNTNIIISKIDLKIENSNYNFVLDIKTPFILKPSEIKLLAYNANIKGGRPFSKSNDTIQTHKITLDTRIIGGTGQDKSSHNIIGTFLEQRGGHVGHELLKQPLSL